MSRRIGKRGKSHTTSGADRIVAETAGKDSWKTYAGRNHGTDDFEVLDVFRGMKRSFYHHFLATVPSIGSSCPVCFCIPKSQNEWHITWCGHAVCKQCLQQYASIQVRDKEHTGPLKCPVCPQVLRRKDAIVALDGDAQLIQQWDTKLRNQLLRALPNFRPCPKCNNLRSRNEDDSGFEGDGGGFVTPECLQPHYDERRDAATKVLRGRNVVVFAFLVLFSILISIMSKFPSTSPSVDLFFMFVLIYPVAKAGIAARYRLARSARQMFFKPITVECPCCNESFILPAESKFLQDDETSRWLDANTRQCPSCSAKIVKTGGCNHMHCSNCRADFCWACMRLRTSCKAYRCVNGARYGNAVPGGPGRDGQRAPQDGDSILTVIDYLLEMGSPQYNHIDLCIVLSCFFARQIGFVQVIVGWIMNFVCSVLFSQVLMGVTIGVLVNAAFQDTRRRIRRIPNERQLHAQGNNVGVNPFAALGRNIEERFEREMMQEAIRRSIEEM